MGKKLREWCIYIIFFLYVFLVIIYPFSDHFAELENKEETDLYCPGAYIRLWHQIFKYHLRDWICHLSSIHEFYGENRFFFYIIHRFQIICTVNLR